MLNLNWTSRALSIIFIRFFYNSGPNLNRAPACYSTIGPRCPRSPNAVFFLFNFWTNRNYIAQILLIIKTRYIKRSPVIFLLTVWTVSTTSLRSFNTSPITRAPIFFMRLYPSISVSTSRATCSATAWPRCPLFPSTINYIFVRDSMLNLVNISIFFEPKCTLY